MHKYDFYRGWYLPSNGIIANVVLYDLALNCQKSLNWNVNISKRWELSQNAPSNGTIANVVLRIKISFDDILIRSAECTVWPNAISFDDMAFGHTVPSIWNSLPLSIRQYRTLQQVRSQDFGGEGSRIWVPAIKRSGNVTPGKFKKKKFMRFSALYYICCTKFINLAN